MSNPNSAFYLKFIVSCNSFPNNCTMRIFAFLGLAMIFAGCVSTRPENGPTHRFEFQRPEMGVPFRVIGVYHYQASFLSGGNQARAIVPIETARRALQVGFWGLGIAVIPAANSTRDNTIDDVVASMRGRRGLRPGADNTFAILTQDQLFEVYNKIFGAFFLVMLVLSAVAPVLSTMTFIDDPLDLSDWLMPSEKESSTAKTPTMTATTVKVSAVLSFRTNRFRQL